MWKLDILAEWNCGRMSPYSVEGLQTKNNKIDRFPPGLMSSDCWRVMLTLAELWVAQIKHFVLNSSKSKKLLVEASGLDTKGTITGTFTVWTAFYCKDQRPTYYSSCGHHWDPHDDLINKTSVSWVKFNLLISQRIESSTLVSWDFIFVNPVRPVWAVNTHLLYHTHTYTLIHIYKLGRACMFPSLTATRDMGTETTRVSVCVTSARWSHTFTYEHRGAHSFPCFHSKGNVLF